MLDFCVDLTLLCLWVLGLPNTMMQRYRNEYILLHKTCTDTVWYATYMNILLFVCTVIIQNIHILYALATLHNVVLNYVHVYYGSYSIGKYLFSEFIRRLTFLLQVTIYTDLKLHVYTHVSTSIYIYRQC